MYVKRKRPIIVGLIVAFLIVGIAVNGIVIKSFHAHGGIENSLYAVGRGKCLGHGEHRHGKLNELNLVKLVLTDKTAQRHVLAHELTHYRHGDHLWSLLRCVAVTLHWYNPLVWLAAALSRRDAELACDEGTLHRLGEEERTAYEISALTADISEEPI